MATLVQAVRMALHYGETHLGVTDIFGEDVGPPLGGVFTATQGLKTAWNSPLDERGIIGTAMGIAYAGGRPVAEIQFCDYGFNTIDLLKVAGNQRWSGAGNYPMPIVVMTPSGSGIRGSLYHSHSFESWASRLAGWKIVMPSNALDAYGLMLSAIADPNPVLVLLPKALLRVRGDQLLPGEPDAETLKGMIDAPVGDRSGWQPRWPDLQEYFVQLGQATFVREGEDATVVSYGRTLPLCKQAADQLQKEDGLRFEVIDLRILHLDGIAKLVVALHQRAHRQRQVAFRQARHHQQLLADIDKLLFPKFAHSCSRSGIRRRTKEDQPKRPVM